MYFSSQCIPLHTQLSAEIKDLLDKIFVVDEGKRITVDEIKEHPWYNKPLPEPYKAAWDNMRKKQEELDESRKDLQRNEVCECLCVCVCMCVVHVKMHDQLLLAIIFVCLLFPTTTNCTNTAIEAGAI